VPEDSARAAFHSGRNKLITDLYDLKCESLVHILTESYFPEVFDSPTCLRILKEAALHTYLPFELCKSCMNDIERQVTGSDWTDELRTKSRYSIWS
jgi:hypothetical protein